MKELDGRSVVGAGGWDPRYAVTLAVASHQDVGAALIDTNGDGADVDLDVYELDADGTWQFAGSSGVGESGGFLSDRTAVLFGRDEPGLVIAIEYGGRQHSVVASAMGWWIYVASAVPGSDASPTIVR